MATIDLNEATLLAYVDGHFGAEEAEAIEAALAKDPKAQAVVDELRQCPVDLVREAFDAELDRPLSPGVTDKIRHSTARPSGAGRRISLMGALVASLFLLCVGLGGGFMAGSAYWGRQAVEPADLEAWIVNMAAYQKLYARETVAGHDPSAKDIRDLEVKLGGRLGFDLHVPDLSPFGLTFKRGQILAAEDGRPIAQLVYLGSDGPPIALCLVPTNEIDKGLASANAEGLNLVYWTSDSHGYALMGEQAARFLEEVAAGAARQLQKA